MGHYIEDHELAMAAAKRYLMDPEFHEEVYKAAQLAYGFEFARTNVKPDVNSFILGAAVALHLRN